MDEREQQRKIRRRLGVLRHAEEVSGRVAATYRYYGISRPTFYKWLHRFEELGEDGRRDRSSRPHRSPNATPADIVTKIVYLRRYYHFGPHKISMYLCRCHDIEISPSTIWRILKRLDMNRLPSSMRQKRHSDRWMTASTPAASSPSATTGRLHHIGVGRAHRRTPVLVLVDDRGIRIINATTGGLLRHLTLDYQLIGSPNTKKPGP